MSLSVQNLLKSFDLLAEVEKREIAFEILRRVANFEFPSLTDEELVFTAEAIFLELDNSESHYDETQSRRGMVS